MMTKMRGEEDTASLSFQAVTSSQNSRMTSSTGRLFPEAQSSSTDGHFSDSSALTTPVTMSEDTPVRQKIDSAFQGELVTYKSLEISSGDFAEQEDLTSTVFNLPSTDSLSPVSASKLPPAGLFKDTGAAGFSQSSERSIGPTVSAVPINIQTESSSSSSQFSSSVTNLSTDAVGFVKDVTASSVSQFSGGSTEQETTTELQNTTDSTANHLSAVVSSIFPNVTHSSSQDSLTTTPANVTFSDFTFTNLTLSPFVLCPFPTAPNNNDVTTNYPHPGVYDVTADRYDVSEDGGLGVLVAKAVTLGLLALMGVAGNALVIWSVVRQRHLHRPPFYYLLSLSLTDLSRAAFCLPLVLMTLLQGSVWRHGDSACDLFAFANSFFVLSSSVSLLDIAADRHLSLVYPYSYKRRSAGAVNLVVVLLSWTVAFLVSFPPVVGLGAYAFETSEGQCTLRHKFFRHDNDTLGFLLVFTLLLLITLLVYYRVFLSLRAHRKMRPLDYEPARSANWSFVGPGPHGQGFVHWFNNATNPGGANLGGRPLLAARRPAPRPAPYTRVVSLHVARNQHVIRLFFFMTLTFTALWLPYQVLSYWRVFGSGAGAHTGLVTAAAWLSYGQVVVCPLVYFSSRGPTRRRASRGDVSPDDKQHELLLESLHRQK